MTTVPQDNRNCSSFDDGIKKENNVPFHRAFFCKNLVRKILFGMFLGVIVFLTLTASFHIALNRVRKTEHAMTRATELMLRGRFEESLGFFNEALEGNSRKKLAWSGKGLCLMYLKRYDEALKSYEKLIKLDHDNLQGWQGKAMSLEYLGRFDEALESYNRALEINPQFEFARTQRKQLLEKW